MIAYVSGKIEHCTPTQAYIDLGGLAYDVQISLNTFESIEGKASVKLFTHLIVREDAHTLYGFYTLEEKDLFIKLISVSGIGPNTARVILSFMTAEETKRAILSDNVVAFKKVKGVGPKTAKRIILDLKDKLAKEGFEVSLEQKADDNLKTEAVAALVSLGFQRAAVVKQVDIILKDNPDINQVESLIKMVLRQLS